MYSVVLAAHYRRIFLLGVHIDLWMSLVNELHAMDVAVLLSISLNTLEHL